MRRVGLRACGFCLLAIGLIAASCGSDAGRVASGGDLDEVAGLRAQVAALQAQLEAVTASASATSAPITASTATPTTATPTVTTTSITTQAPTTTLTTVTTTTSTSELKAPATPPSPLLTAGDQQVLVVWSEPHDSGLPITEYQLDVHRSEGGPLVTGVGLKSSKYAPATSHTVRDLINGTEYQFKVRAMNEAGWSAWGPVGLATPEANTTTTTVAPTTTLAPAVIPLTEATVANENFFSLIRAQETWELGYTGAGSVVAVLDMEGFDSSHPDFLGKVLVEVCTSGDGVDGRGRCGEGEVVLEDAGAAANSPGERHGTGVAGVVQQVAPGVEFVFIKPIEGSGQAIERAYEWVAENSERFGIDVVVHSMGAHWKSRRAAELGLYPRCYDLSGETKIIPVLRDLGIMVVNASGNDGHLDFINHPGCHDAVISVGAVGAYGTVRHFSNVSEDLTFLAPTDLMAPTISERGRYEPMGGTSGAAPVVAAMMAIGRQASPDATVDELIEVGRSSAVLVDDYLVKDLRLVDLLAFVQSLTSLPTVPRGSIFQVDAFQVDAVYDLEVGSSLQYQDLYHIGGFTFAQKNPQPRTSLNLISGDGSSCNWTEPRILAIAPGTCVYEVMQTWYSAETWMTGPWETRVIQFEVVPVTIEIVQELEVGDHLQPNEIYSIAGFTFHDWSVEGGTWQAYEFLEGDRSSCEVDDDGLFVALAPGTCVYQIAIGEQLYSPLVDCPDDWGVVKNCLLGPGHRRTIQFNIS